MTKQNTVERLPPLTEDEEKELRQEWQTPIDFIEAVNAISRFPIDADCAASDHNALCVDFYSRENSGLCNPWIDREHRHAWCNPGFADMFPWIDKARREADTTRIDLDADSAHFCKNYNDDQPFEIDVLGLCSPSTEWFDLAVRHCSEILLLSPRVQFVPPDPRIVKSSNARENALFRFNEKGGPATIRRWKWK